MNNNYYKTLDENFNEALNLAKKALQHDEMIEFLRNGNIPQKQIAALNLDTLTSAGDTEILISNLTGQDGKIREAVSAKIKELLENKTAQKYFLDLDKEFLSEKFIDALTDINGNICRNIIDSLYFIKNYDAFVEIFIKKLISLIYKTVNIKLTKRYLNFTGVWKPCTYILIKYL